LQEPQKKTDGKETHMKEMGSPGLGSETGFQHTMGMRLVEWGIDRAVMELDLAPQHLNSHGSIHGGMVAAMIDNTGGMAGLHARDGSRPRRAVTLSLTTSFIRPVRTGTIRAEARKRSGGERIYFSTVEVTDEAGNLVATGEATYRYIKADAAAP
jgi:uncharacterized protein (TIGR00369 family)